MVKYMVASASALGLLMIASCNHMVTSYTNPSTTQKQIASADSALLTARAYLEAEKTNISRHDMSKPEAIQEIHIQGQRAWRVSWKLKNFTGKGGQLVVIVNEDGTCERGWGE